MLFSNFSAENEQPPREKEGEKKQIVIGMKDDKTLDAVDNELSTEEHVRAYFANDPILIRVAWCETKFEHWDENGRVLRGEVTPKDIGVMQINEYYHGKTVDILGINIHTLEGNLAYAYWLYKREGLAPWAASKDCWKERELALR